MHARMGAVRIRDSDLSAMGLVRMSVPWTCPDFNLENLSGGRVGLSESAGNLRMIHFWCAYCPAFRSELLSLEELYERLEGRNFALLSVNNGDPFGEVQQLCRACPVRFPVLLDPLRKTAEAYGVSAVPSTFLLDRKGLAFAKATGARDWSSRAALEMLHRLMGNLGDRNPAGHAADGRVDRKDGSGRIERRKK